MKNRTGVSLEQAKNYYLKNPDRFRVPETFAIQTISIMPPEKPTPAQLKEVRKHAEDALNQARATKDYEQFGMLAEKISEDDYRVMMGDRRAIDRAKLPPEVLQAAQSLQPGPDQRAGSDREWVHDHPAERAQPGRHAEI